MAEQVDETLRNERMFAALSVLFSVLALALSAGGLSGIVSHAVTRRTPEIGIRMALGATAGSILRLMLGDAWKLVAVGVGIGLPAAA